MEADAFQDVLRVIADKGQFELSGGDGHGAVVEGGIAVPALDLQTVVYVEVRLVAARHGDVYGLRDVGFQVEGDGVGGPAGQARRLDVLAKVDSSSLGHGQQTTPAERFRGREPLAVLVVEELEDGREGASQRVCLERGDLLAESSHLLCKRNQVDTSSRQLGDEASCSVRTSSVTLER